MTRWVSVLTMALFFGQGAYSHALGAEEVRGASTSDTRPAGAGGQEAASSQPADPEFRPIGTVGRRAGHHGADQPLVVAAVSIESDRRHVPQNLESVEKWARKAADAGAELVLFPEAALSGWWASREVRNLGEPLDGPSITRLIRLAKELGIVMAVGMTEKDGKNAHITHVLLDGSGVIGTHRKTIVSPGEEKYWDRGDDANVFELFGWKVGIAICYETVKPEMCRRLKANGAEIVLAPYANGTRPEELKNGKRPYTYARAKENGVWYVACDAVPHDKDGKMEPGAAYVISPEGELKILTPEGATDETMVVFSIPAKDGTTRDRSQVRSEK